MFKIPKICVKLFHFDLVKRGKNEKCIDLYDLLKRAAAKNEIVEQTCLKKHLN